MLRVQIESLVAGIDGAETILTTETATVGNLIAGFVFERRLPPEIVSDLSLQDDKGNVLKHHRTVASYELKDGDKVYLTRNDPKVLLGCRNWFAMAVIAFLISVVGFSVVVFLYFRSGDFPFDFVGVVDAGSTHTDLFIYQWHGEKFRGTGIVEQVSTMLCEAKGLENYADAREAAKSLTSCLTNATKLIPAASLAATEIYLGATAGMRLLAMSNLTAANAVLDAIRTEIRGNYDFKYNPENIRIITGQEEGAYGWMTANFLAKTLPSVQNKFSYGALDLGGASTQIAFVPEVLNSSISVIELNLFSQKYELYSQSYLCYGLREAERKLKASLILQQTTPMTTPNRTILNPCQPLGNFSIEPSNSVFGHYCTRDFAPPTSNETSFIFEGVSDSASCAKEIEKLFNVSFCSFSKCSFDDVFEPPLSGAYLAFSGYYSSVEFLNLTNAGATVPLVSFRNATNSFCAKNWTEISHLSPTDPHSPFLTQYCFDAHFVDSLLTKRFGFTESNFENIKFMKNISGTAVGWSLGLALNSTNARAEEVFVSTISTAVFASLIVLFAILLLFAFIFMFRAYKVARRYRNYEPLSTYGAI